MNIGDYIRRFGDNDPLIESMKQAYQTDDLETIAQRFEPFHALAEAEGVLEPSPDDESTQPASEPPPSDQSETETEAGEDTGWNSTAMSEEFLHSLDSADFLTVVDPKPDKLQYRAQFSAGQTMGPYTVVKLIGKGTSGCVYEAFPSEHPDHHVAIKVFENDWLGSIERWDVERLVLQWLQHPNLVSASDFGQTPEGYHYLVMNLVVGQRIDQYVKDHRLDYRQIARMFIAIAGAMEYAHENDVLHRDLKPGNILVASGHFPVVTDFGLARRLNLQEGKSLTRTGELIGTLGYLAPEQANSGRQEVTRAADVYGLGATLYKVLTEHPPLERENLYQAMQALQSGTPKLPNHINPAIPDDLQTICMKCLEKQPQDRYASMELLAEDLQRFTDGRKLLARATPWYQQAWRWCQANPLVSALSMGLLAAVFIGLITSLVLLQAAVVAQRNSDQLLTSAQEILQVGDKTAEGMLQLTPGSLEYRQQRLQQTVQFFDQLIELHPNDTNLRREAAVSYFRLGKVCLYRGLWKESEAAYRTALSGFEELAEQLPDEHKLKFDIFHSLLGIDGAVHTRWSPSFEETDFSYKERAFQIIQDLCQVEPDNPWYRDAWICTATMVAKQTAGAKGDHQGGIEMAETAWKAAMELKQDFDGPPLLWRWAGASAYILAMMHSDASNFDAADRWLKIAFRETREYIDRGPPLPEDLMDWTNLLWNATEIEIRKGNEPAAREYARQYHDAIQSYIAQYPDHVAFQNNLNEGRKYFLDEYGFVPWEEESGVGNEATEGG